MRYKIKRKFRLNFQMTSMQKKYILLITALYFGVALGSLVGGSSNKVGSILVGYAQSIHLMPAPSTILLNNLIINFVFFCGLFLLGMSVYGYIFIPIIPFIKGFSYGFMAGFYFKLFGAKGILICAMSILPQVIMSGVCLMLGAYIAFHKSLSFSNREQARSFQKSDVRQYCLWFLLLFAVSYLAVFMDIFLSGNVIKLFC